MGNLHIGQYDKSVKGRKAKLKVEISFYSSYHVTHAKSLRTFAPGTIVTAVHKVYGTGLTTFEFTVPSGKIYQHVVREGKFEYID